MAARALLASLVCLAPFAAGVPEWCGSIPERLKPEECREGGTAGGGTTSAAGSCACVAEICSKVPAVLQKSLPTCCGCAGTGGSGGTASPATTPSEVTGPVADASWCQYMPKVLHGKYCEDGSHACRCEQWCQVTPADSQGWNPLCCGCETATKGSDGVATGGDTALTQPDWCRFVPKELATALKIAPCVSGTGGQACECKSWCWSMPRHTDKWNPMCCGCNKPGTESEFVDGAKPKWCDFMPPAKFGKFCSADRGAVCQCKGWCHLTPSMSRPWNPECCGCAAEETPKALTGNASNVTSGGEEVVQVEGVGDVPAWCKWVPDADKRESCTSGMACSCDDMCQSTPEKADSWNPSCCGCGYGQFKDMRVGGTERTSYGRRAALGLLWSFCALVRVLL